MSEGVGEEVLDPPPPLPLPPREKYSFDLNILGGVQLEMGSGLGAVFFCKKNNNNNNKK